MKRFTVEEVEQAFRRVEDQVAKQGADAACMWAIHYAIEDGLRVLVGELTPEDDAPDEDGLRQAVMEAKTVEAFDAAVLRLLGTFDDRPMVERARIDIDATWRPSTRGNEATLLALEVYRDKRGQAEGRGEATREAHVFAQREARNRYAREMGE